MRSEEEMIAYALEIDASLLRFVPELLADFDELGSDAEAIVEAIDALKLPASATVIDLGCGKGAVAVEIAGELGLRVTGFDLFAPFITECDARASEAGVTELCTFIHGDVAKLAGKIEPADVVVYAALGDVLGPIAETMQVIRQYAKPGGHIIVSDGYLRDGGSGNFPGFEKMKPRNEMIAAWIAHGDVLVSESVFEDANGDSDKEAAAIWHRANMLAEQHPELKDALLGYARGQSDEYDFLAANIVSALWTFRKRERG
jgi:cyclopropane fatty-acyl-phospholipid synthase-like methyltransferase